MRYPAQTKDALYHITLAILVGLCGGIGAIVLRQLISFNYDIFFNRILPAISYEVYGFNVTVILLPVLGGLIVGLITAKTAGEAMGHGIPEVIESVNVYGGRIRGRVAFIKALVSSITIGSGGSGGREGPIGQIGASLGSLVGQKLNLGERHTRLLVACGLAAGIGATFNAPLGGAIFAMEILLTEFEAVSATYIILASVVGTTLAVYLPIESLALTTSPAFNVKDVLRFYPQELVSYLLMGLFFGLLSILWVRSFYRVEGFFDRLRVSPMVKPAIGGFLTGIIGVFALKYGITGSGYDGYGILGSGYEGVDLVLLGIYQIPLIVLILLGIGKILATSFTVGSGGSGGILAPTLYIGCMFGGAFGMLLNQMSPGIAHDYVTYALVGMGALFAGAMNAPLTCIIMIPEMVDDWSLLAPMMAACVSSYLVFSLFMKENINTLKLLRRGVVLDIDHVLSEVRVGDIMTSKIDYVQSEMKVSELIPRMLVLGHTGYPVMKDDKLFGIVTFDDLQGADFKKTVEEVCTKEIFKLTPKNSVQKAVRMLYEKDVGRLIVVDKDDPEKVVGIVSRSDIIKAYQRMLDAKKRW